MADRPNILLIIADQHRRECLGAYGNAEVKTPHLDALAAGGTRYNQAFCAYPVCTPSRYSIFSGTFAHEHRGWSNHCTPAPGTPLFPGMLREAGYRTAAVGKMHFTPTYLDIGLERLRLSEQDGPGRWDDDYHRHLKEQNLADWNDLEDQRKEYRAQARAEYWETFGAMVSNLPEEHHSTTWIADRGLEVIRDWTGSDNFLAVSFIKPHHPFDPPAPWHEMCDPEKLTLLPGWTEQPLERNIQLNRGYFDQTKMTEPALRRVMAYYYATISQIDYQVGRLVAALREKGVYDNTVIVYVSDHGEYMGYQHLLLKANYMYDPLVRVPLIIKFPYGQNGGSVSDELVSLVDLAPTLLGLAGIAPHEKMRGRNLGLETDGPDIIFSEEARAGHAMARTSRFKLIEGTDPSKALFFDLEQDPHELENRIADAAYAGEVQRLRDAIVVWRGKTVDLTPHLDETAPQIPGDNVPEDLAHRPAIEQWYAGRVAALKAAAQPA